MPAKSHGMSETRQFEIWSGIKKRCDNKNSKAYPYYGGRGITYDPKWRTFEGFWEDMKDTYSDDLELDRVDINGDYCKLNCRWVSGDENKKNKGMYFTNKTGVPNTYLGVNKGIDTLYAKIVGDGKTIRKAYSLRKYSIEEAINLAKGWIDAMKIKYGYGESHGKERISNES